jgi:hypothetical protein
MGKEEERIKNIIINMARGNNTGHKLSYDPVTKRILPILENGDPDGIMTITPEDNRFAVKKGG